MIGTSIIEIDIDNIEELVDLKSNNKKNKHLKNPFAQAKLNMLNKRSLDQPYNNDIEHNIKRMRQELSLVQMIIENNNLLDDEVIEIEEEIRKDFDSTENELDKTELSKSQYDNRNFQEKNEQNPKNICDNNTILDNNNQADKENLQQKNDQVEENTNDGECEVVWVGLSDHNKSIENYIKEEVEKRVKEKVEAFESIAKTQIMEHELLWMNKYRKLESEFTGELEKQKNEEVDSVNNEIQEEHKDELVQTILLEKKLEEKEIMLKSRIERLKLIEEKFVQQISVIKEIRKQNRELLKMKIKEWEDKEKFSQDDQQEISAKDNEVLIDDEALEYGSIDAMNTSKSKSSTKKINHIPNLNKSQELVSTELLLNRTERKKCRPTRMSHGEWEIEKNERNKRKRNLKIRGLSPGTRPKDLEVFFKKELGVQVNVEHIIKVDTDMIVQLKDMIDKIKILKRMKHNNCGIIITNDFTTREEEVQRWLKEEGDWLRSKDYSVKTEYMKLMINGINWVWNDMLGDLVSENN